MSKSMTPKRAIEILKSLTFVKVLENNAHSNGVIHSESACKKDNEDLAAIQMAISALEYRIPKKPEQGTTNAFIYACPACGGPVGSLEVEEIWCDFCPKCGQAIDKSLDWSDEECANG